MSRPPASCLRKRTSALSRSIIRSRRWWRASVSYLKYNSQEPGENNFGNISSPSQWLLGRVVNATQVNSTMTAVFDVGGRVPLWI